MVDLEHGSDSMMEGNTKRKRRPLNASIIQSIQGKRNKIQSSSTTKNNNDTSDLSEKHKKMMEHEKNAALRTYHSAKGCNLFLPRLPNDMEEGTHKIFRPPQKSHPYGVKPYANKLFSGLSGEEIDCRLSSFVSASDDNKDREVSGWAKLNDDIILAILQFCNGYDIGNMVQTCNFFYIFGHHDDLWRDLVLQHFDSSDDKIGKTITTFLDSWRNTFVFFSQFLMREERNQQHQSHHQNQDLEYYEQKFRDSLLNHVPLKMKKETTSSSNHIHVLYSDTLYRTFLCSSFEFDFSFLLSPSSSRKINHVSYVNTNELDPEEFLEKYERRNCPCILTNIFEDDENISNDIEKKKSTSDFLTQYHEIDTNISFRATSGAASMPATFTIPAYLSYCSTSSSLSNGSMGRYLLDESPLYLFDRTIFKKAPSLIKTYTEKIHESCPFMNPSLKDSKHDLFRLLGETKRPDYRWLIIGPSQNRSGSSFHIDPNCTHAWNLPVKGAKYWIFYPPGVNPPGVFPSANGDDVAMPISLGEWFLTYWDEHCKQRHNPDKSKRPYECIVKPGELLFVPHGWWHSIYNIGDIARFSKKRDINKDEEEENNLNDDVCIALTQNYVSHSNLSDVIRFLKTREQQISGIRDRPGIAVSPGNFYNEFKKVMSDKMKNIWDEAEEQANQGWKCKAWTDQDEINESKSADNSAYDGSQSTKKKKNKSSILEKAKTSSITVSSTISLNDEETTTSNGGGFTFSFL